MGNMSDIEIEAFWSGYDEEEAKRVLNTEHPDKMMLKMYDGLFIIVKPEDFKRVHHHER